MNLFFNRSAKPNRSADRKGVKAKSGVSPVERAARSCCATMFESLENRQMFSGTGLSFHLTYEPSVTSLPNAPQIEAACSYVANEYSSLIADPITVNIDMFATTKTSLGESFTSGSNYSFTQFRNDLVAHPSATLNSDQILASLPQADPTHGKTFYTPIAMERALGFAPASSTALDGRFAFNPNQPYTFDPNHRAVNGKYDFIGVAEHEFSEIMGRQNTFYDLFRFTSPGVRDLTGKASNAYFSIDNGNTKLKAFNTNTNGDLTDWASGSNDAYNAFSSSGVQNGTSATDLAVLNSLGYRPSSDAITAEHAATAGETDAYGRSVQSLLGAAVSGETLVSGVSGAVMQKFQGGAIYWSPSTGSHAIIGGIASEYAKTANETDAYGVKIQTLLGLPTSDETNFAPVAGSRVQHFQGGSIYWSASTGAHAVIGGIVSEYNTAATETNAYGVTIQKVLGLPTSDETNYSSVSGARIQHFQGGSIYWSASTGAHAIIGGIASEYATAAHETNAYGEKLQTLLGLPIGDEMKFAPVSGARVQYFQGGSIYWTASTGAHAIIGGIASEYTRTANETDAYGVKIQSLLGVPTSDETAYAPISGARVQHFQGGLILWSASTGAHAIIGGIASEYATLAGETTAFGNAVIPGFGLPTTDETAAPGTSSGRMQSFTGGAIYWSPSLGAHAVYGGIVDEYNSLGASNSWLGLPKGDETGNVNVRIQYFENGYIEWINGHGAFAYSYDIVR